MWLVWQWSCAEPGTMCLSLPPAQLHLGTGGLLRDTWWVWGQGVPLGLLSPVHLSISLSLGACRVSQAVNSRKLPGRHMEGAGWGQHEP